MGNRPSTSQHAAPAIPAAPSSSCGSSSSDGSHSSSSSSSVTSSSNSSRDETGRFSSSVAPVYGAVLAWHGGVHVVDMSHLLAARDTQNDAKSTLPLLASCGSSLAASCAAAVPLAAASQRATSSGALPSSSGLRAAAAAAAMRTHLQQASTHGFFTHISPDLMASMHRDDSIQQFRFVIASRWARRQLGGVGVGYGICWVACPTGVMKAQHQLQLAQLQQQHQGQMAVLQQQQEQQALALQQQQQAREQQHQQRVAEFQQDHQNQRDQQQQQHQQQLTAMQQQHDESVLDLQQQHQQQQRDALEQQHQQQVAGVQQQLANLAQQHQEQQNDLRQQHQQQVGELRRQHQQQLEQQQGLHQQLLQEQQERHQQQQQQQLSEQQEIHDQEMGALRSEMTVLKASRAAMQARAQQAAESATQQRLTLQQQVGDLQLEQGQLQQQVEQLGQGLDDLQQDNGQLQEQVQRLQAEKEQTQQQAQVQVQGQQQAAQQAQEMYQQQLAANAELQGQLSALQAACAAVVEKAAARKQRIQQLRQDKGQLRLQLEQLQASQAGLEAEKQQLKRQLSNVHSTLKEVRARSSYRQRKVRRLQDSRVQLLQQLAELQSSNAGLQSANEQLQEQAREQRQRASGKEQIAEAMAQQVNWYISRYKPGLGVSFVISKDSSTGEEVVKGCGQTAVVHGCLQVRLPPADPSSAGPWEMVSVPVLAKRFDAAPPSEQELTTMMEMDRASGAGRGVGCWGLFKAEDGDGVKHWWTVMEDCGTSLDKLFMSTEATGATPEQPPTIDSIPMEQRAQLAAKFLGQVERHQQVVGAHGDLKGANAVLTPQGDILLIDFGNTKTPLGVAVEQFELRRCDADGEPRFSIYPLLSGTPSYLPAWMALKNPMLVEAITMGRFPGLPQQILGLVPTARHPVTPLQLLWADVFSSCVLVMEMVMGRRAVTLPGYMIEPLPVQEEEMQETSEEEECEEMEGDDDEEEEEGLEEEEEEEAEGFEEEEEEEEWGSEEGVTDEAGQQQQSKGEEVKGMATLWNERELRELSMLADAWGAVSTDMILQHMEPLLQQAPDMAQASSCAGHLAELVVAGLRSGGSAVTLQQLREACAALAQAVPVPPPAEAWGDGEPDEAWALAH